MRVDALFALLAQALLEVWADSVGGIFVLVGVRQVLNFVDIFVEGIKKGCLLLSLFFEFFAFVFLGFELGHALALELDGGLNPFDISACWWCYF